MKNKKEILHALSSVLRFANYALEDALSDSTVQLHSYASIINTRGVELLRLTENIGEKHEDNSD